MVTGDLNASEDLVQEVFLKVHRALSSLEDPLRFQAWLAGITRRSAIDWLRRRRPTVSLSQVEESAPNLHRRHGQISPSEELQRQELVAGVRRALERLPQEYREVVVLKHLEGLSYRAIAERLETSVSAIESRLFRARKRLRDILEKDVR